MSTETATEHVCYVYCNFCNTVLAVQFDVSVPRTNMFNIVTVRCGHCGNLLSVNMGGLMLQSLPLQGIIQNNDIRVQEVGMDTSTGSSSSSSSSGKLNMTPLIRSSSTDVEHQYHIRPPEKRQRVPSAYNRFIKEEIQRIKANNPDISHREAFSAAAKNWAHFPRINFGINSLESNKRMKFDEVMIASAGADHADGVQTTNQGFY